MPASEKPLNHLDIYRQLKKSNCGYCQVRTCMAFALAVARGEVAIKDCPHVSEEFARSLDPPSRPGAGWRDDFDERLQPLRDAVAATDFSSIAGNLGAVIRGDTLCLSVLGKEFCVTPEGNLESEVHINPWVTLPILKYVATAGSGETTGAWISFDQLSTGTVRGQYFTRRCEEPLRQLVDDNEQLFSDLMTMVSAQPARGISADRTWVLQPLPKVPVLVVYWRGEDQFPSRLRVLLDGSVERFLDPESVYVMVRGLVEMLERLVARHGAGPGESNDSSGAGYRHTNP